jgi:hypothetical protein
VQNGTKLFIIAYYAKENFRRNINKAGSVLIGTFSHEILVQIK